MKKIISAIALSGLCLLTSCGEATYSNSVTNGIFSSDQSVSKSADVKSDNFRSYEAEDSANGLEEAAEKLESSSVSYKQSEVKTIDTQMLVYNCDLSIDVLEFDDSVDQFHSLINKYKGFIENESYSDGANTGKWQYSDTEKWKTLTAVIRIPSADYNNFCKDAENIGDIRRKNASVQNLTAEYSDLSTTLKIYEAKEKRYLDLLSELKDEKEAVAVESELTNIQIEIARIKTSMNNIENDVAYSYIHLTLNEVREYTEDPVIERTDTFGQRLKNTVTKTWRTFLEFLEEFLFFIIRVFPYLVLFGFLFFIFAKIRKAYRKHKASRAETAAPKPAKADKKKNKEKPSPEEKTETPENTDTENKE